ncbi:hypothetical protein SKAU_G00400970 [Synaphobranchus kaupii]|uniref:Uncharacterized protein n=1 Tax=Synaphobranchus kaupii TaxID=118154 RepID=A0A9Q1E923_SYNKA|nr:hypothetical protein SKAU_G00400970 [Synaphobranchus kaupii]
MEIPNNHQEQSQVQCGFRISNPGFRLAEDLRTMNLGNEILCMRKDMENDRESMKGLQQELVEQSQRVAQLERTMQQRIETENNTSTKLENLSQRLRQQENRFVCLLM